MKKINTAIIVPMVMLLTAISFCNKPEQDLPPFKEIFLNGKHWRITNIDLYFPSGNVITRYNYYISEDSCDSKDYWHVVSDSTMHLYRYCREDTFQFCKWEETKGYKGEPQLTIYMLYVYENYDDGFDSIWSSVDIPIYGYNERSFLNKAMEGEVERITTYEVIDSLH